VIVFDPVTDGKHIVLIMLVTGLVFLGIIFVGELSRWAGERRRERARRLRTY
jgi:hypothetical protein